MVEAEKRCHNFRCLLVENPTREYLEMNWMSKDWVSKIKARGKEVIVRTFNPCFSKRFREIDSAMESVIPIDATVKRKWESISFVGDHSMEAGEIIELCNPDKRKKMLAPTHRPVTDQDRMQITDKAQSSAQSLDSGAQSTAQSFEELDPSEKWFGVEITGRMKGKVLHYTFEDYFSIKLRKDGHVFVSDAKTLQNCFSMQFEKMTGKKPVWNFEEAHVLSSMLYTANTLLKTRRIEKMESPEIVKTSGTKDRKIIPDLVVIDADGKRVRCDYKCGDIRFRDITSTFAKYKIADDDYVLLIFLQIGLVLKILCNKTVIIDSYLKEYDNVYAGEFSLKRFRTVRDASWSFISEDYVLRSQ